MNLPSSPHRYIAGLTLLAALFTIAWAVEADDTVPVPADRTRQQAELASFNGLIGKWRGTGQLRRGSAKGAWREDAEWVWDFQPESVGIRYDIPEGPLLRKARLTFDDKTGEYMLNAEDPDGGARLYRGPFANGRLTLETAAAPDADAYRLTVTPLNEKRTLVLHERRAAGQRSFERLGEVGYTREGTRLAFDGAGQPECVVTGGAGTIKVSYQGKEYYVCCTGCKQAFDDDPAGILADYAERRAKEKAKRAP